MISPEDLENQKPLISFDSKPLNGLRGFVATHLVIFHSLWYSEYNINIYGTVILIFFYIFFKIEFSEYIYSFLGTNATVFSIVWIFYDTWVWKEEIYM